MSHGRMPISRGCTVYVTPLVQDTFETTFLDLVQPLLSLSTLRSLSFTLPSYFDLACTAADLRDVSKSLRILEAFHLSVPYYSSHYSRRGAPVPPEAPPERPRGGPLDSLVHFARNCPRLRLLHLPAMEMTEETLAALEDHDYGIHEPHTLRTLVIPKVLLPPGREDLVGKVSEVVRVIFPLVASPFWPERLAMEEDWATVADEASKCLECACSRLPIS